MTTDPRSRLREALAEARFVVAMEIWSHVGSEGDCPFDGAYEPCKACMEAIYLPAADAVLDAILAVLPEHRDDVLALVGVEQTDSGLSYCTAHHGVIDCDETRCDFWDPDDDRCPYCDGDSVVQRTGPDAKPDEFEDCAACDGTGVTRCSPESLFYAAASPSTETTP